MLIPSLFRSFSNLIKTPPSPSGRGSPRKTGTDALLPDDQARAKAEWAAYFGSIVDIEPVA